MKDGRYQILLVNDDGIRSPGLWAAAEALSALGYVTVAAPREQSTSTGQSFPSTSDGRIQKLTLRIGDQDWPAYAIGGSPAQAVEFALLDIMDTKPDLVVSGINYGLNIGASIGISGTVGAAMEAASVGIPALAASLDVGGVSIYSYSTEVDFSVAAYFTAKFANIMLSQKMPFDVDLLKVDVPAKATRETPWAVTRMTRQRYYYPMVRRDGDWNSKGAIGYYTEADMATLEPDSDVKRVAYDKIVSVTALSIDATSRTDLRALEAQFRAADQPK